MTVRASMATLITDLRFKVGDPIVAGTPPTSVFTDAELQSALDRHRIDVLQAPLTARPTLMAGGYQWVDYQSRWGFWEDDATISDATWVPIAATIAGTPPVTVYTADHLGGHWTFATSILPTLYVTGKTYNLFAAAVDVLRAGQARAAAEFDFAADGQNFSRSQKGRAMAASAAEYQRYAASSGRRLVGLFDD